MVEPAAPVVVCVKWATLQFHVDAIDGTVHRANHGSGFSEADLAAVEVALRIAADRCDAGAPTSVVALCVGPAEAEDALRDLLACGVARAIRISARRADPDSPTPLVLPQPTSATVARLLGDEIAAIGSTTLVCGDVSADRGSGSVPAFLAHHLGWAQALGLVEVGVTSAGVVSGLRRLDGGRRERLHVEDPAVISVEGSVARLRRASLSATISSRDAVVEVREPIGEVVTESPRIGPWRPRTRVVAPPDAVDALSRIVELTGAKADHSPARTIEVDPSTAARAILDQLAEWGYLGAAPAGVSPGEG